MVVVGRNIPVTLIDLEKVTPVCQSEALLVILVMSDLTVTDGADLFFCVLVIMQYVWASTGHIDLLLTLFTARLILLLSTCCKMQYICF